LKKLSPTDLQATQRRLARIDLYFLLRYVLGRRDIEHPWLFDRVRMVQQEPDGFLDLWARAHYKSTVITFAKTIQDILASHGDEPLSDHEPVIAIFSHTRGIAKGFLTQIKQEFERNVLLKSLFPDVLYSEPHREAPIWSLDGGIVVKRRGNPKEATVEAWGLVDSQPTSRHFDVMIYDDVVDKDAVTTPEQIAKTTDAFRVSTNLGSAHTRKRGIGTRWHFADTYRTIINEGILTERKFPATVDGTFEGAPVFFTQERLQEWIRDNGATNASAQLMQNPALGATDSFKREDLRYYDGHIDSSTMNRYLLVDPANAKKKSSDYTAAAVLGLGQDRNVYLLDMVRDRLGLRQRADLVIHLHRKWSRPVTGYEKYGKDADIEYIEERQAAENYRFDIVALPKQGATNLSKHDRIQRLIPIVSERRLYLPRKLFYTMADKTVRNLTTALIEEEMLAWPVPVHDDMLDAIARLFDMDLIWPQEQPSMLQGRGYGAQSWNPHQVFQR
jgi:phage terminase large subunit-like protein